MRDQKRKRELTLGMGMGKSDFEGEKILTKIASCLGAQLSVTGASSVSLSSSVTTTTSAVATLFSSDASFDFFCDP